MALTCLVINVGTNLLPLHFMEKKKDEEDEEDEGNKENIQCKTPNNANSATMNKSSCTDNSTIGIDVGDCIQCCEHQTRRRMR